MTTREQFGVIVMAMKSVYTKQEFLPNRDSINVWYELLKDIDYEILSGSVQSLMMTSPFPPTIADIRSAALKFMPADEDLEMPEMAAWDRVRRAIRNSGYHSEEEYWKLPGIIRKAVGSAANLEMWAKMDSETLNTVEQSQFLRTYRTVVAREKELQALNPATRELLAATKHQKLPEFMPDLD